MTIQERKALILKSKVKGQVVQGKYVDLYPCTPEHGETIVRLRNQEKSRYHLNQKEASTIERQNAWYNDYALRDDDLYWCIYSKTGNIIGVIRLYHIKADGSAGNQGSFIIDEAYAMSGPYALETELLTLDFCFYTLQMEKVLNDNRVENKNMNSISRRIGFQFIEEFERDDANFNLYELTRAAYKRADLVNLMEKWGERA